MSPAVLLLTTVLAAEPAVVVRPERVGRFDHPAICEASGLVASRTYPDVFWTHNDSGNPPALFAVRRDGSLVREFAVAAPNVDWEDVAIDDHGHLYLGDIGNNGNRLPLRAVYRIDEPDPARPATSPLKITAAFYYTFPPGGRFDAEGLVVDGDRALIVAKSYEDRPAAVYSLPLDRPAPLLRPAIPERVGTLPGFTPAATGASLSADGRRLAVCGTGAVAVFLRTGRDDWTALGVRRFSVPDQIEAVAWDGDDVLLAGEARGVYRVPASGWKEPRAGRERR